MAEAQQPETAGTDPLRVLLVDNDEDVAEIVSAILSDEGYEIHTIGSADHDSLAMAVGRLEPDCILLDGSEGTGFGRSWGEAAYMANRTRAVPVVMFTAHAREVSEARTGTSDRALAAKFAAVVPKPFALDELLDAVASAAGRSQRFDRSDAADGHRTRELVEHLRSQGATDIRTSERREWATFTAPHDDCIYQLYWWQKLGVYIVGRYDDDARLERVGQFVERRSAIAAALDLDTEESGAA